MQKARIIPIILLSLSAILGLVRGLRMAGYQLNDAGLLYQYPVEKIAGNGLSNYHLMGWLFFVLVGVLRLVAASAVALKFRHYSRLIIMESVFVSFFCILHLLLNGFAPIHLVLLPLCLGIFFSGIYQTLKDVEL